MLVLIVAWRDLSEIVELPLEWIGGRALWGVVFYELVAFSLTLVDCWGVQGFGW